MHVNPYLIIEDEKYLVDDFTFGFSQKPNAVGLPATFPVFQGLDIIIRGHYPGFFLERWACASSQPKLVALVLKPLVLGSGPTHVFTFFDAHLVHFTKNYSEKKNPPVEMHLKITAGGVRDSFSKSEYSATWRETFEKPGVVAARSTTEEECVDVEQEEQTNENSNWHDPVDNPMLCLYSQNGKIKKPWHGSFGEKIRDGLFTHTGMDLFALPGSNVYACVKGKVVRSEINSSLFGQLIVVKVLDKKFFKNKRKENFQLKFADKGELESKNFNHNGEFYLLYAHLKERRVEIGNEVKAGQVIGLSGTSGHNGIAFTTCNPHVHFEIINVPKKKGLNQKCNPGVYLHYKNEEDLTTEDIALQEKARTDKTLQKQ